MFGTFFIQFLSFFNRNYILPPPHFYPLFYPKCCTFFISFLSLSIPFLTFLIPSLSFFNPNFVLYLFNFYYFFIPILFCIVLFLSLLYPITIVGSFVSGCGLSRALCHLRFQHLQHDRHQTFPFWRDFLWHFAITVLFTRN